MAKKKKRRLRGLTIGEVSLVDSPANDSPFLFVKRTGEQIEKQETVSVSFNSAGPTDTTSISVNGESIDMEDLKYFTLSYESEPWEYEGEKSPNVNVCYELSNAPEGGVARYVSYRFTKNRLTSDYFKALPDESYMNTEKRYLPYKNAEGKVDADVLKAGIRSLASLDIPEEEKTELKAKAEEILAKRVKESPLANYTSDEVDAELASLLTPEVEAIGPYMEDLPAIVRDAITNIVKVATCTEPIEKDKEEMTDTKEDKQTAQETKEEESKQPFDTEAFASAIAEQIGAKFKESMVALTESLKEIKETTVETKPEGSATEQGKTETSENGSGEEDDPEVDDAEVKRVLEEATQEVLTEMASANSESL